MNEETDQNSGGATPKQVHTLALIFALCEDQITPEQFRELDSLVCNDPEIAKFYVDVMQLKSSLRRFASYFAAPLPPDVSGHSLNTTHSVVGGGAVSMDESMVLPALSDAEPEETDGFCERFEPTPTSFQNPELSNRGGISPAAKRGIAALVVLMFGLIVYVAIFKRGVDPRYQIAIQPPVPAADSTTNPPTIATAGVPQAVPVATLNFTQFPVWSAAHPPPQDGKFFASQVLGLESGDVQLSFQSGGRLVIEGPAEIEFVSDHRLSLHKGKIVATVPGGGLVVDCPHGSVTDLGTQFGMDVNPRGATEVAVFQGRVAAALSSTATTQGTKSMLLGVGQAATISPNALAADQQGAMPQRFVRNLVNTDIQSLDVTDLVSGGDGTTRRWGIAINGNTGQIGTSQLTDYLTSDGKYHRVSGYPIIDGVFIPDGGSPGMIVDSAGDQYKFAPAGNQAYGYICTGGKVEYISSVLGGVDYNSKDHDSILLHSNNALTLDLDAIRRIYPDRTLTAFHCLAGNSFFPRTKADSASPPPIASVYVLVDGKSRFEKQQFLSRDGGFEIRVPLSEKDRFLTLVSTDAGKGNSHDWILWGDAKLDLTAGRLSP